MTLSLKKFHPVSIYQRFQKYINVSSANSRQNTLIQIVMTFFAARASYGCQTALLRFVEDWKHVLDNNIYVGVILIYLS